MLQEQSNEHPLDPTTLVVGNIYEFAQRHNAGLPLEYLSRQREVKENFAVSAEASLYWAGPFEHCVALLPALPGKEFVEWVSSLYHVRYECIIPKTVTGWVCRDTLADLGAQERLVAALQGRQVFVAPWTATDDYYALLDFLQAQGIALAPTDSPEFADRWVIDYSDSKIGSRSILATYCSAHPRLRVPPGYICKNPEQAIQLAHKLASHSQDPLILKSDRGDGGKSVILHQAVGVPDVEGENLLRTIMSGDLWDKCGVVVEEAIGRGTDLTTPSFDGYIAASGAITALAVDNMLTVNRQCVGVELGYGVIAESLHEQLLDVGLGIGRDLATLGFRGWFDVDFLLPSSGDALYASEINPRRGGATAPYQLAERIHGKGWQSSIYVKSYEKLWLRAPLQSFAQVAELMRSLNERFQPDHAAVLPMYSSSCTLSRPYVGYIVYGPNVECATTLEQELAAVLPSS